MRHGGNSNTDSVLKSAAGGAVPDVVPEKSGQPGPEGAGAGVAIAVPGGKAGSKRPAQPARGDVVTIEYDDGAVRAFMIAAILWALVGLGVGVLVATQLSFWKANFNLEWLTFGRLRPLHTNAAIFAFVGNMMFAGIYYSTQRLCRVRLASDLLTKLHFWGWQGIIVAAAITLPLGYSRGKEYAELIWPINIAVVVVWVIFAINFFWTLAK